MIVIGTAVLHLPRGGTVTARIVSNGEREPLDKSARPRRYAYEFGEHERALAWTREVTFEHHNRFGLAAGCSRTGTGTGEGQ